MARQVQRFACTIPAGTLSTANFSVSCKMNPCIVQQINIRVPPGPRGNVGFRLGSKGAPIFPDNSGAYVITDNDYISWPVQDQPEQGSWELQGYNNGQYDHVIYVEFLTVPIGSTALAPSQPVPNVIDTQIT